MTFVRIGMFILSKSEGKHVGPSDLFDLFVWIYTTSASNNSSVSVYVSLVAELDAVFKTSVYPVVSLVVASFSTLCIYPDGVYCYLHQREKWSGLSFSWFMILAAFYPVLRSKSLFCFRNTLFRPIEVHKISVTYEIWYTLLDPASSGEVYAWSCRNFQYRRNIFSFCCSGQRSCSCTSQFLREISRCQEFGNTSYKRLTKSRSM